MPLLLLLLLFLAGCTTPEPQNCQEADWYEIGRRQGAQGEPVPENIKNRIHVCQESDLEMNYNMYLNGRNAGLVDYCKPTNGFELGKGGKPYFKVCPPEQEASFLRSYEKGKKVRELQEANVDLDRKISNLLPGDPTRVENQIKQLRKLKADNLLLMNSLEDSLY